MGDVPVAPIPAPPPAPPTEVVAQRVRAIRRRIAEAGRDPATVRVVAVTKGFGVDAVRAALGAGLDHIGENYAAELLRKADVLAPGGGAHESDDPDPDPDPDPDAGTPVRWHYLGAVQRRRVRDLAPVVAWWDTVSRAVEGQAIAGRAPGATVLVEVESTGAAGRNGAVPTAVPGLVAELRGLGLDVRGLMTVAPAGPPEEARAAFRTTARLAAELGLAELSMGMTDDLEVAVAEGSTMVRVGRALFGERPPRAR